MDKPLTIDWLHDGEKLRGITIGEAVTMLGVSDLPLTSAHISLFKAIECTGGLVIGLPRVGMRGLTPMNMFDDNPPLPEPCWQELLMPDLPSWEGDYETALTLLKFNLTVN